MKLEMRLILRVIIQFFVCGSEFRARWHNEIEDSCRSGKFLSKSRFCQNCRLRGNNTLQAKRRKTVFGYFCMLIIAY
jgi:hypothetical protein